MEEEKPKKKELTVSQRLWLQAFFDMESKTDKGEYITFGNKAKSALKAYYPDFDLLKAHKDYTEEEVKTYNAAKNLGWENHAKLGIEIDELMDEAGLTDVFWLQKLRENTEATRLYGKMAIEHPDYNARNKAVEIGLRVKKKLIDRIDHTNKGDKFETVSNKQIAAELRSIITSDDPVQSEDHTSNEALDTEQVQE